MKKISFLLALFTCLALQAQNSRCWVISAGGSFPVGKFAAFSYDPNTLESSCGIMDYEAFDGGAATGINIGIETFSPIINDNLFFTMSADFCFNSLNDDAKKHINLVASYFDMYYHNQLQSRVAGTVYSSCAVKRKPSYFNFPILAGLRYAIPINNMVLSAEAGAGMNLRFISPIVFRQYLSHPSNEFTMDIKYQYSMKGTLAFRLGADLRFTEKLSLAAYFYYLGKSDVFVRVSSKVRNNNSIQPSETTTQFGSVSPMMAVVKLCYSL